MYDPRFTFQPYIGDDTYIDHANDLLHIQSKIYGQLEGYENFAGVDFCDVHAGGIQIRGHHKKVSGYTFPATQPTIKKDFSNMEEVIDEFVKVWKSADTDDNIDDYLRFIAAGEKYGWD